MRISYLMFILLVIGMMVVIVERHWPRPISEISLSRQLSGNHCQFAFESGQCRQRGLEPLRALFTEQHDCDLWAVQCLKEFRSEAAIAALIRVLSTKTDIQTCDGVRRIRTSAVKLLGEIGDRSALPALRTHLASQPSSRLSAGAAGCRAGPEDTDTIRGAIAKIEGR